MDKKDNIIVKMESLTRTGIHGCEEFTLAVCRLLIDHLSPCAIEDKDLDEPEVEKEIPKLFKAGDVVKCVRNDVADSRHVYGMYGLVITIDQFHGDILKKYGGYGDRCGVDFFGYKDGHSLSGKSQGHKCGFWVYGTALEYVTHIDQFVPKDEEEIL